MIFVSDQPASSKWWWIGAIRNTRLRKRWKANTWTATDSASITKIPPITMRRISVFVITASAAMAPPNPSDPVSPMNTDAGNELNHRKPTQAPTRQALRSARSCWPGVMKVIGVGEQHDRGAAGREAVEAVREVHPIRGAGEHEEDQDRVGEAELDRR